MNYDITDPHGQLWQWHESLGLYTTVFPDGTAQGNVAWAHRDSVLDGSATEGIRASMARTAQ